VVLDLQGGYGVAGVGLQVVEGLCLGVGDSDRFGDAAVDGFFEGFPGLAQRDVFECDGCVLGVLPPGLLRVSFLMCWRSWCVGACAPDSGSSRVRRISMISGTGLNKGPSNPAPRLRSETWLVRERVPCGGSCSRVW
jgi:hypothetical protein